MSGKIKSTLELAMEKAAKLPRLTEEEIRQRREEEYAPRGRAIAALALEGDLDAGRVEAELSRYGGDEGEIVRRAFLESLCEAPDFEDAAATPRAFEVIRELSRDADLGDAPARWSVLQCEYEEQKQLALSAMEQAEADALREIGVSGSAIRPNLEQKESWRSRRSELQREFQPRLEELRRELADRLGLGPASSR